MRIAQILYSQGFGTRRACAARLARGEVAVGGKVVVDDDLDIDLAAHPDGFVFEVEGTAWRYQPTALLMLHKPAGYECSAKPRHHPGVLTLLPEPLRVRGVQPVGRLDEDTTGLLLLSDAGALIHRLTSPKHHVPKVYEVGTRHPVDDAQLAALRAGIVLDDDPRPTLPAGAERTGERALRLTLTEGRYHQVKRMLAAVGNRVETLHRSGFGPLALPPGLAPGQWRWIDGAEPAALLARAAAAPHVSAAEPPAGGPAAAG